jgi:hypothetical protein
MATNLNIERDSAPAQRDPAASDDGVPGQVKAVPG